MNEPILHGAALRNVSKTICWSCMHAVPCPIEGRGCSWSMEGKPVEGWKAERRDVVQHAYGGLSVLESYCVIDCPSFCKG